MSILVLLTAWLSTPAVGARGQDVRLAERFDLGVDQTATIAEESLQVRFDDIVSDSRCPRGVQCFWQGVAVVRLSIEKPPDARTALTFRFNSTPPPATYGRYSISVVDVKPYPEENRRHRREEYVVTVIVTRAE